VTIPQSIKWARAKVTPTPGGGAIAEIEALDETPELAEQNAKYLTQSINSATFISLGIFGGHRVLEPVSFHAEGSKIYGTATATREQLETALAFLQAMLNEREQRRRSPPAPPAVPTPPG